MSALGESFALAAKVLLHLGFVAQILPWDSSHESSVITGRYEQLGPYEIQDHELVVLQRCIEAARIAIDLVLSGDDLDAAAQRQARSAAKLQRCGDPDLPYDEGAVWYAVETDDGFRSELPAAGWAGLGRAGLQHALPPPEDAECKPAVSRRYRPAQSPDR